MVTDVGSAPKGVVAVQGDSPEERGYSKEDLGEPKDKAPKIDMKKFDSNPENPEFQALVSAAPALAEEVSKGGKIDSKEKMEEFIKKYNELIEKSPEFAKEMMALNKDGKIIVPLSKAAEEMHGKNPALNEFLKEGVNSKPKFEDAIPPNNKNMDDDGLLSKRSNDVFKQIYDTDQYKEIAEVLGLEPTDDKKKFEYRKMIREMILTGKPPKSNEVEKPKGEDDKPVKGFEGHLGAVPSGSYS